MTLVWLADVASHKLKVFGLVGCVLVPLAGLAWGPEQGTVWLSLLVSPLLASLLFVVVLLQSIDPRIDPAE